jgi:hypothetical protein
MQKDKYAHILCFGEVLWDMLPSGAKPGGAPLNVAIHLKRQLLKIDEHKKSSRYNLKLFN